MIRHSLTLLALFSFACCFTGCGGGGTAKFDPSEVEAQTQEEIDEAKAYEEQMAAEDAQYESGN